MSQLFICPKAHFKYTPVPGLAPPRETCLRCGQPFLYECRRCGERYTGDDADTAFHDCGERIPWAKPYAKEVKKHGPVTWDYWEQMAHEQEGWQEPPNLVIAFLAKLGVSATQGLLIAVAVAVIGGVLTAYALGWLKALGLGPPQ